MRKAYESRHTELTVHRAGATGHGLLLAAIQSTMNQECTEQVQLRRYGGSNELTVHRTGATGVIQPLLRKLAKAQ